MRTLLPSVVSLFLLSACAQGPRDGASHPSAKPKPGTKSSSSVTASHVAPPPAVRPLTQGPGVILSVNDTLRFVVVDFSTTQVPQINSRLGVYRGGQKVAELNASGPIRNGNVVADIRAGEVKVGDEVRAE